MNLESIVFLIPRSFIIIGVIYLLVHISKNKSVQELYISLENILSKLGNNEINKLTIISAIAKAMKDAEKDGTGKVPHKTTKTINAVIKKIGGNQYELAIRRSIFSFKFQFFLFIVIGACIFDILVSFDYVSPSFKLLGEEINFQHELAFKIILFGAVFIATNILWTAIKIASKKAYNYAMNKFIIKEKNK